MARSGHPGGMAGSTGGPPGDTGAVAATSPAVTTTATSRRQPRIPKPLRRAVGWLAFVLVVEHLVLPQIAGTRKAVHLLAQVDPVYLLIGFGLEAASVVAYAQLTRSLIPAPTDPGLGTVLRIQLTTLGVSHCVPGGTAAGSSLGYRLMTGAGVDGADVGFALGTQSLGSAVVLNLLLWLALVVSIPLSGFNPLYLTVAVVGAVLLTGFGLLVLLLTRGEDRAADLLGRISGRLPVVDGKVVTRVVHRLAARLRELAGDRPVLYRAVGWAAANWLLDAASLWMFVAAFGHRVGVDGLLVAYGLANVLAAIPLTPGGLGIVEGVLTSSLVGFGTPRGVAILGVLSWRLVNFWLPIPVGAASYVSLRLSPHRPSGGADRAT
jgi:uncharacterized protein (TIRG00374 family)